MRGDGPFVFAQVKSGMGTEEIAGHVLEAQRRAMQNVADIVE